MNAPWQPTMRFELRPPGAVVYLIRDADDQPIYVGMSGNPLARVASHLDRFGARAVTVEWESYPTRTSALERERELLRELRPVENIAGVGHPYDPITGTWRPTSPDAPPRPTSPRGERPDPDPTSILAPLSEGRGQVVGDPTSEAGARDTERAK